MLNLGQLSINVRILDCFKPVINTGQALQTFNKYENFTPKEPTFILFDKHCFCLY